MAQILQTLVGPVTHPPPRSLLGSPSCNAVLCALRSSPLPSASVLAAHAFTAQARLPAYLPACLPGLLLEYSRPSM